MDRRYVGIDLHRRRSVIYAMHDEGDKLYANGSVTIRSGCSSHLPKRHSACYGTWESRKVAC